MFEQGFKVLLNLNQSGGNHANNPKQTRTI